MPQRCYQFSNFDLSVIEMPSNPHFAGFNSPMMDSFSRIAEQDSETLLL
jgi:hypothetical protein